MGKATINLSSSLDEENISSILNIDRSPCCKSPITHGTEGVSLVSGDATVAAAAAIAAMEDGREIDARLAALKAFVNG